MIGIGCQAATPKDSSRTGADSLAQSSDANRASAPSADTRPALLIIGTSLTAGLGLEDPEQAYPGVLQRKVDSAHFSVRVVNAGVSGETSAGALRRLPFLLTTPARFVVIETGANDGLRGLDPDSTAANLDSIVRLVRQQWPTAQVGIVQMEAPPNLGPSYTTKFHNLFGTVAKRRGVELLPFLLNGVAGIPELNQGDGIHPNATGAGKVAENLWPMLKAWFELGASTT